jgi:predicted MarR family transcription regulator
MRTKRIARVAAQTTITLNDDELDDLTFAVLTAYEHFDRTSLECTAAITLDLLTKLQSAMADANREED